jgi:hypothetical protein
MTTNIGSIDRVLRVLAGVTLVALTVTGTIGVWGWIGLVPLATAALGWCPLYTVPPCPKGASKRPGSRRKPQP